MPLDFIQFLVGSQWRFNGGDPGDPDGLDPQVPSLRFFIEI